MFHLLFTLLVLVESLKDVDSSPIRGDATDLQGDWVSRVLKYVELNPETLEELTTNDYAVLEGDVVLPRDRNAVETIWPTVEIPYIISPELARRTYDILSALSMVSEHTCVSFHKRTSETNYLLFKTSKGCASYVGFIGGQQPVLIGPPCIVGNIVHEILHTLGFHHEHTRMDRDKYITILPHNIIKGMETNFKEQKGQTFNLGYDISSIMHYGSGFFSANGLPTIVPRGDSLNMGQRVSMTETDIERVRHLYNCDAGEKKPKEGSKVTKEGSKVTKEGSKVTEEGNGVTKEGNGVTKEGNRVTKEGNGVTKEGSKVTEEGSKVTKEGNRVTKEGSKVTEEGNKVTEEGSKVTEEGSKVTKEGNRVTKEGSKVTEEGNKVTEEGSKVTEEGSKVTKEGNRVTKEGSKVTEEGSKVKECSCPKMEADANVHKLVNYVASTLDNHPEEDQTPTSASPSALLQHLDAATRGQNNTSREEA